jgi:hypothetical protein
MTNKTPKNIDIQDKPVTDSPNNDAFEAIVEVYYQTQGYITSAGKWFWVWEDGKKQRGYQDIDVLAINANETMIVSVTSNLDDKINTKEGSANPEKLEKLKNHFDRVQTYLNKVEQYRWMVSKPRKVRYVIAYNHAFKNSEVVKQGLRTAKIESLTAKEMLGALIEHAKHDSTAQLKCYRQVTEFSCCVREREKG